MKEYSIWVEFDLEPDQLNEVGVPASVIQLMSGNKIPVTAVPSLQQFCPWGSTTDRMEAVSMFDGLMTIIETTRDKNEVTRHIALLYFNEFDTETMEETWSDHLIYEENLELN